MTAPGAGPLAKPAQQGFALLGNAHCHRMLMIGLLAVADDLRLAIGNTTSVQYDSVARQKAAEANGEHPSPARQPAS